MTTNITPFHINITGFVSEDVIVNLLKRHELAEWFNNVIKNQMRPNHPGYMKLTEFPKILKNSLEKTEELYEVQSKFNISNDKLGDVTPENFYFAPLFQSHEIWHTMAQEIKIIFQKITPAESTSTSTSTSSCWEKIIQLNHGPQSPSGRLLISLLLADQVFPLILSSMKTNATEIKRYIDEAKDVLKV